MNDLRQALLTLLEQIRLHALAPRRKVRYHHAADYSSFQRDEVRHSELHLLLQGCEQLCVGDEHGCLRNSERHVRVNWRGGRDLGEVDLRDGDPAAHGDAEEQPQQQHRDPRLRERGEAARQQRDGAAHAPMLDKISEKSSSFGESDKQEISFTPLLERDEIRGGPVDPLSDFKAMA